MSKLQLFYGRNCLKKNKIFECFSVSTQFNNNNNNIWVFKLIEFFFLNKSKKVVQKRQYI